MNDTSNVFLKDNVRAMLAAIMLTNEIAMRALGVDAAYRVGFVAAITVVCMAFGIDPASVSIKLDSVLPGGRK